MTTSPAPARPMTTRSWYITRDRAGQLADAITDLHFRTRRPKHEILDAALAVALEHEADILIRLARAR